MAQDKPNPRSLQSTRRRRAKARGEGFFAAAETHAYEPLGSVVGQFTPDSCVAACCRMLLRDYTADVVEAHLRIALGTDEQGTLVSQAPAVLRQLGLPLVYVYHADLTLVELQAAVQRAPAMAAVKPLMASDWHALLVDGFAADGVLIRDPLPAGRGAAYKVSLTAFLLGWALQKAGHGAAAIVI